MSISVIQPFGPAWQRMVRGLFQPFNLGKWFTLGFCAFLASCGEGGMHFNFNANLGGGPGGGGGGSGVGGQVFQWVQNNVALVALIVLGVTAVGLTVAALVFWLQSRGKFMFIDGLVLNRGAVAEPWRAFQAAGDSLFKFKLTVTLISTAVTLAGGAIAAVIIWPDLTQGVWSARTTSALVIFITTVAVVAGTFLLISLLLEDFVAPAMYVRSANVMEAWSVVNREVFKGHVWVLTLFYVMRFVIGLGAMVVAAVATCATCCMVAIPYLGTVILLPVIVFQRWYSLCFLEQFGPGWHFWAPGGSPLVCPKCDYDLRGNPSATTCPECGAPVPGSEAGADSGAVSHAPPGGMSGGG